MSEFSEFMAEAALTKGQLLIVGDFNIHIDSDSSESEQLKAMLDTYNLSQNVTTPTHNRGHILDLVLTRSNADTIRTISVTDQALSDHSSITFTLHTSRSPRPVKTVSFHSFKSLDKEVFKADLSSSLFMHSSQCPADLLENFNMTDLLDKHALLKHREMEKDWT